MPQRCSVYGGNFNGGRYWGSNSFDAFTSFGAFSITGTADIACGPPIGIARVTGLAVTGAAQLTVDEYEQGMLAVPFINLDH